MCYICYINVLICHKFYVNIYFSNKPTIVFLKFSAGFLASSDCLKEGEVQFDVFEI